MSGPTNCLNAETIQGLRALDEGEGSFLKQLIPVYLENANQLRARIEAAVQQQNSQQLYEAAHTLKSSSQNLGADQVSQTSRELEQRGRSNQWHDVQELLSRLLLQFAETQKALTELFESIQQKP